MKIKTFLVLAIVAIGVVAGWKILSWGQQFKKETGLTVMTLFQLAFHQGVSLKEANGRTNMLVLGIAGGSHEGADLTDTMLMLSLDQHKRSLALISVPRDIWSDTLKDKVNSAYHYGEQQQKGGGLTLAKTITEEVVGFPIQYGFVIDFSGFKKIIDLVGGVDVVVPKAFTDPDFPIEGKESDVCGGDPDFRCRYEALHFDAGMAHMDGTLALKYVRSRHAEGEEGSDFARSRRQQDVLVALKQKLVQPNTLLHPILAIQLFHAFDDATDMDMTIGELLTIGKVLAQTKPDHMKKISLDDQLETPPLWQYGGRYVLIPKESFEVVHEYIRRKLF